MSTYSELHGQIKECKTHEELLKLATMISNNSKELRLDQYQMEKLENSGIQKYEEILRVGQMMIKNKKQGFNNFE